MGRCTGNSRVSGDTGGGGWIRTNVGVRQRIYSPSPLASRAPLHAEQRLYGHHRPIVNEARLLHTVWTMSDLPVRPAATYRTIEMHTGGEPVRLILEGFPEPRGATVLEKRGDASARLDIHRRRLMLEPRGHAEMYGALPVEAAAPAAFGVLFMHHSGFSTMCGHATIALGRWAVESGRVALVDGRANFIL